MIDVGTGRDMLQDIYDCEFTVKQYAADTLLDGERVCWPYVKPSLPVPLAVVWAIWVDRNRSDLVDLADLHYFDATVELLHRRGWVDLTESDWGQAIRAMTAVRLNEPDGVLNYPLPSGGMCVIHSGYEHPVMIPPGNAWPPDVGYAELLPHWRPNPYLGVEVLAPPGTPPSLADSVRYSTEGNCRYIAITAKGIAWLKQGDQTATGETLPPLDNPPPPDGPQPPNLFWYEGRFVTLQPRAWNLLDHIWRQKDRCGTVEEVASAVWPPPGEPTNDAIYTAQRRANAALREVGFRSFLEIQNGHISLPMSSPLTDCPKTVHP